MVSVTEETPYLSGLLAGMTVMTLMTVICRGFLNGGGGYVFHRRWISSIVQSLQSGTCSTGFWGGNLRHHSHHFGQGVVNLRWVHMPSPVCLWCASEGGTADIW
jgi:hypothetical protein